MTERTPLNPMMTPTFPAVPGKLIGTSIWVLQVHKSGKPPIWNGPLPGLEVAEIANKKLGETRVKTSEELETDGYSEEEIKVIKDILCVVTYKAEVVLTPLDDVDEKMGTRKMGFLLPHQEEKDVST